jgi:CheY-like chemotaxis protein
VTEGGSRPGRVGPAADRPGDSVDPLAPGGAPDAGRIIIVDDEVELVQTLGAMLRHEFGAGRVHDTADPCEALGWVERERPAVLITDVRMPGLSGLDLIVRVRELWGAVPTVVMTSFPSLEVRSGATSGTFRYLPKPFLVRALLDVVREFEAKPPPSFTGAIAVSTLADLLQLYIASGTTGVLTVKAGGRRGEAWFDSGQIVHACTAGKEGFEAFCDIVRWPHGSFTWRARRAVARTIEMRASELLLEAYRIWDESRHASDDLWEDVAPGDPPRGSSEKPGSEKEIREIDTMNNINETLSRLQGIEGFLGACLVDSDSGMTLGIIGGGAQLNIEIAAASNTEVVRAKRKALRALNLKDEIEDILITLGKQYHLIRPLRSRAGVFFYLALERSRANLAMARINLADAEKDLTL